MNITAPPPKVLVGDQTHVDTWSVHREERFIISKTMRMGRWQPWRFLQSQSIPDVGGAHPTIFDKTNTENKTVALIYPYSFACPFAAFSAKPKGEILLDPEIQGELDIVPQDVTFHDACAVF